MTRIELSPGLRSTILGFQQTEITEHFLYRRVADSLPEGENKRILRRIADDELRHYEIWRGYTGVEVTSSRLELFLYYWLSRVLGFTFGVKLMERSEGDAAAGYRAVAEIIPEARQLFKEEEEHEKELLGLLDEERLRYAGSVVLGLNDALVELTGALAGLTLALQNTRLIALTGLITGIAAALSMAASEFLSTRSEGDGKNPLRASLYTGTAYIGTVALLIFPYLAFTNYFLCLGLTLVMATLIIASFNFYIAVAKDEPFKRRFLEMAGLSFGVALFSFFMGWAVRVFLGIEAG